MRLKSRGVVISWAVFAGKETNENHSDYKSPDMRPPRNASGVGGRIRKRGCAVEELNDEPEAKHNQGRDFDELDEDEDRNERQDLRERIRNQVRAEDARNRATGADARNGDIVVEDRVDNSSAKAPLAPTVGTSDAGPTSTCVSAAANPPAR